MKDTSGSNLGIRVYGNHEIQYYMHKARVMRAEYIAGVLRRIAKRIVNLFRQNNRTVAKRAGKPVQV